MSIEKYEGINLYRQLRTIPFLDVILLTLSIMYYEYSLIMKLFSIYIA